ncbi:hypothetical protein KGP36_01920 [Patescibacteria group bacterium]|nr:hypothetical protein [Patescibacteria group bacterium]
MTLKQIEESAEGGHITFQGVSYQDAESFLCSRFGFCGCGSPEKALEYMLRIMGALEYQEVAISTQSGLYPDWNKFFNSEEERMVIFYLLDDKGLTTHGTGLSTGGWLTLEGRQVLDWLREWKRQQTVEGKSE